jgi:hypothetical protein
MHLLQRLEGRQVLNTSYIKWLNGMVQERLATLTHKYHHAAQRIQDFEIDIYLIMSTYNFCCFHQELSTRAVGKLRGSSDRHQQWLVV